MDELKQQIEMYCEDCLARGQSARTAEAKRGRLRRFLRWREARGGPLRTPMPNDQRSGTS